MPKDRISFYVVALLDILGQKQETLKLRKKPSAFTNDVEKQQYLSQAKETIIKVKKLRKIFQDQWKKLKEPFDLNSIGINDVQQREVFRKYNNPDISIQFLGDSTLLKIHLGDAGSPQLMIIDRMLRILPVVFISFLAEGIPLRGAIDIGECIEIDDNDLYGAAVTSAYLLEQNCADYPRMVVSSHFLEFIRSHEIGTFPNGEEKIVSHFVNSMKKQIETDPNDHCSILSWLYKDVGNYCAGSEDDYLKLVKLSVEFVKLQIKKYKDLNNQKLFQKYEKLSTYIKSKNYWD